MYERATRCLSERGGAGVRRKWLAAALACLRLARPEHAFIARPAHAATPTTPTAPTAPTTMLDAQVPNIRSKALQVIGPEELAAELRAEDPESVDPVQQALQRHEPIDFDYLYPNLKNADVETLLAVTKRAISTEQFLPRWFLLRFMLLINLKNDYNFFYGFIIYNKDGNLVHAALHALGPGTPQQPRAAPLALADLLLAELDTHQHLPQYKELHDDLQLLVKEYTAAAVRISENIKLTLQFTSVN
ncbi:hypothetical protein RR48_07628 [Papilio machaon]|uniref:Uncharacterized protein n=1 Tax=Papilio machaon TaxID=76193 RepID=A0A194QNX0_PAPMA|nr:hypothetical protein RR48_07628 [Papilio machaon]